MAATYSFAANNPGWVRDGSFKKVRGVLTIAGTYTASGDVLAVTDIGCGLSYLERVNFVDGCTSIGQVPAYYKATGKILLFEALAGEAPLAEVDAGEACAGTINVEVLGY